MPRIQKTPLNLSDKQNIKTLRSSKLENDTAETSVDVKLALLEKKLVPRDLIKNFDTINMSQATYLYVDDNGKPGKILALDIIPKEVTWNVLSKEIQDKILVGIAKQNKLIPGDHIVITENNEIKLSLTADDLGAISKSNATEIITEQVKLQTESLPENIKEAVLESLKDTLSEFRKEIGQTLYENKQEIINFTDNRIANKLDDLDTKIDEGVANALTTFNIDGGLIIDEQKEIK